MKMCLVKSVAFESLNMIQIFKISSYMILMTKYLDIFHVKNLLLSHVNLTTHYIVLRAPGRIFPSV